MSVTYTPNIELGLQLDKTEYLDWDVITENWRKIDAASGGGGGTPEIYPETLCFETSFPQNAPEADVFQSYTWTPCGKAWGATAKHGDEVSDRRFSVSSDVPFLAVMVFGCVYSKTYEELRPYPEGDDWTKVHETEIINLTYEDTLDDDPDPNAHYGIKVYSKRFDAGTHTITYKYGTGTSCMLFRFYNAQSVSDSGVSLIQDTYTTPAPRGNQRVYLICQNNLTGSSWRVDDYEPSSGQGMSTLSDANGYAHLYAWYDFQPEENQQPTFVCEDDGEHIPDAESATCLTLDIVW